MSSCESTVRQMNRKTIEQDVECLGFLSFGRDCVFCGEHIFSLQRVSTACELTVGSIISCCESYCIADAYSLLRKYRDDCFFYLYVVVYDACNKSGSKSTAMLKMQDNIERWINNDLDDLHIGTVLQAIGQSSQVKDAVQKYNLKSYFDCI